jgi:hypothetical protein
MSAQVLELTKELLKQGGSLFSQRPQLIKRILRDAPFGENAGGSAEVETGSWNCVARRNQLDKNTLFLYHLLSRLETVLRPVDSLVNFSKVWVT